MCIPHGMTATKDNGYIDDKPRKKHVRKVSKEILANGDPNYDGEVIEYKKPKPKGFFEKLFGL
jgi:hypothetical protein